MKQVLLLLCCIFTITTQAPAYALFSSATITNEISFASELPIKPSAKKAEKKGKKIKAKPEKQTQSNKGVFIIGILLLIGGIGSIIYFLVSGVTGIFLIIFIVIAALMALFGFGMIYIIRGQK